MNKIIPFLIALAACTTTSAPQTSCVRTPYDDTKCGSSYGFTCQGQGSDAAPDRDGACALLGDTEDTVGNAQSVWCCAGSDASPVQEACGIPPVAPAIAWQTQDGRVSMVEADFQDFLDWTRAEERYVACALDVR